MTDDARAQALDAIHQAKRRYDELAEATEQARRQWLRTIVEAKELLGASELSRALDVSRSYLYQVEAKVAAFEQAPEPGPEPDEDDDAYREVGYAMEQSELGALDEEDDE